MGEDYVYIFLTDARNRSMEQRLQWDTYRSRLPVGKFILRRVVEGWRYGSISGRDIEEARRRRKIDDEGVAGLLAA